MTPPPEEATTPGTFAEYLNGTSPDLKGCSRCGKPGTVMVTLAVRSAVRNPVVIAKRQSRMCEACAVAVFDRVATVLR